MVESVEELGRKGEPRALGEHYFFGQTQIQIPRRQTAQRGWGLMRMLDPLPSCVNQQEARTELVPWAETAS